MRSLDLALSNGYYECFMLRSNSILANTPRSLGWMRKSAKNLADARPLLHRAARVRGTKRKWREIDESLVDTHHTGTTGY
jgi:hypothetical protein